MAILDYIFGISYRKIKQKLKFLYDIDVCIASIYKWIRAFSSKIAIAKEKKERKLIAVDETVIKNQGRKLWIWAAIDVNSKEMLVVHISIYRNGIEAKTFLKKVLELCSNKPLILVDRGPWYNYAVEWLKIDCLKQTFGKRNAIEYLFKLVKDRTRSFYNNFGSKYLHRAIACIYLFLNMFNYWYKEMRDIC